MRDNGVVLLLVKFVVVTRSDAVPGVVVPLVKIVSSRVLVILVKMVVT